MMMWGSLFLKSGHSVQDIKDVPNLATQHSTGKENEDFPFSVILLGTPDFNLKRKKTTIYVRVDAIT